MREIVVYINSKKIDIQLTASVGERIYPHKYTICMRERYANSFDACTVDHNMHDMVSPYFSNVHNFMSMKARESASEVIVTGCCS